MNPLRRPPLRCIVDTNVLVTAAGANEAASPACVEASIRALRDIVNHGHVFIDDVGRIIAEYRGAIDLSGKTDTGEEFLEWLIENEYNPARVTRVPLTSKPGDENDFVELPAPPAEVQYDPSDRKFLAVAVAHPDHPPILQTLDSKWWGWREALAAVGVHIHFLCPSEIARKFYEKMGAPMEFFRFPRTPHLAWLGAGQPRDDKVLSPAEAEELLQQTVTVEEKLDGANLGLSLDGTGDIRAQNRGAYLELDSLHPQFRPLRQWLAQHRFRLIDTLTPELIVFGEWCYAMHSVPYTRLPDWFIGFDIYDRSAGEFWSVERRDRLMEALGIAVVPRLARGQLQLHQLLRLLDNSLFGDGPAEGLYVRVDKDGRLVQRAKLVRAEFTQAIGEHWSRQAIRPNSRIPTEGSW